MIAMVDRGWTIVISFLVGGVMNGVGEMAYAISGAAGAMPTSSLF